MSAPFTEGYSYQDNLLSEYQHKLGHEVTVLTGLVTRDSQGRKITVSPCDKLLNNGVRLIRIDSGNRFCQIIGYIPNIDKILQDLRPDLIFIHGLCSFIPIAAVKYKKTHPKTILVADNHQDKNNFSYNRLPFVILLAVWRRGWKRWASEFNHIYGTTGWRRDFLIEHFGIPAEKTDILLLGVDVDNISSDHDRIRKEVRDNLNIPSDAFVFIHGGKMNANKKTTELVKAFKQLDDASARLILFGTVDGNIKDIFYELVESDCRIIFIGYIESKSVHKYFLAADFSLFPGLHSVLWEEAIGCGLPGLYNSFGQTSHTNICENSISISTDADASQIFLIINKVVSDNEYFFMLKRNAVKAANQLSYYTIAKRSLRK